MLAFELRGKGDPQDSRIYVPFGPNVAFEVVGVM